MMKRMANEMMMAKRMHWCMCCACYAQNPMCAPVNEASR